jgi:hypothetical protein
MIINISNQVYRTHFKQDPHPFISESFINLNQHKVERVMRLVDDNGKFSIGLLVGVKEGILKSPFSAPFGGFHFSSEELHISEISNFINNLKEFIYRQNFQKVEVTLPPEIYHTSFNAKLVNSFIRNGFKIHTPEITNYVNLNAFDGTFSKREVNKNIRAAIKNNTSFHQVTEKWMQMEAYEIIAKNREINGRKIFMTFSDLLNTMKIIPIDFFLVKDSLNKNLASAIFYRGHKKIVQGVFWGDTETGRPLRVMDFLAMNLYLHYRKLGFDFIDLGISTEDGFPNEGLIRFKEIHNATSSPRFSFTWTI